MRSPFAGRSFVYVSGCNGSGDGRGRGVARAWISSVLDERPTPTSHAKRKRADTLWRMEQPWSDLRADFDRYGSRPALVRLLWNQGLWASVTYRFARWVRLSPRRKALTPLTLILVKVCEVTAGVFLSPEATIGGGLLIGHFGGVIVGSGVTLGRGCTLNQGVTIGQATGRTGAQTPGSPTIGDHVYVAAGAIVFGPIHVGESVMIGANSVVNKDLPHHIIAGGVPAKILRAYESMTA